MSALRVTRVFCAANPLYELDQKAKSLRLEFGSILIFPYWDWFVTSRRYFHLTLIEGLFHVLSLRKIKSGKCFGGEDCCLENGVAKVSGVHSCILRYKFEDLQKGRELDVQQPPMFYS